MIHLVVECLLFLDSSGQLDSLNGDAALGNEHVESDLVIKIDQCLNRADMVSQPLAYSDNLEMDILSDDACDLVKLDSSVEILSNETTKIYK